MEYELRAVNEYGDPILLRVRSCWRCGALVDLNQMSMGEHDDRMHPPARVALEPDEPGVEQGPRHRLGHPRT